MTTIATDGHTMVCDGMRCRNDTIIEMNAVKIQSFKDGTIIGCSGASADINRFLAWFGSQEEKPKIEEHFAALVLKPDGTCSYYHEPHLEELPAQLPTAIGSGMDFAIAAMDAGAPPFVAVEIACKRDPWSGGTITIFDREDV